MRLYYTKKISLCKIIIVLFILVIIIIFIVNLLNLLNRLIWIFLVSLKWNCIRIMIMIFIISKSIFSIIFYWMNSSFSIILSRLICLILVWAYVLIIYIRVMVKTLFLTTFWICIHRRYWFFYIILYSLI